MILNTYQGKAITWQSTPSVSAVSGQSFDQCLKSNVRDCVSNELPAYAGTTVTVSGWVNTTGLTGHPTDGGTWNVYLGVWAGSFLSISTVVPAGTGWTFISGTVVIPAAAPYVKVMIRIDCTGTGNTSAGAYYVLFANLTYTLSWNGVPILPMPSSPAPAQLDFEQTTAVSVATSPFTIGTQMQVWPGAEQWACNVSLPAIRRPDAWQGWLLSMQGRLNTFQMGDASRKAPSGTAQGTPLVDGSGAGYNLPCSSYLHTKGWTPNQPAALNAGDYLQIGVRLHRVTATVAADNNGNALIPIWPSIREQPGDGQLVIVTSPKGLWRLADNKATWTERPSRMVGLSFKVVEAR